jgi:hypothetical protein
MKRLLTLFLLGCLSIDTAAAQPPQTPSRAKCLQKCLDDFRDNMDECEDSCFVCDVWILWCWRGHTDRDCMETCSGGADDVYEACVAECGPPPPPRQP